MNQLHQIARTVQMVDATRFVNIRGYIVEVNVAGKTKQGEWICYTETGQRESVPEHLFYHKNGLGFLELRDSAEFRRNYSDHPVEIENLPSL